MVNIIKCLGPKINCNISPLNLKNVDFYSSFTCKGITFCTGEFVLINDTLIPHRRKIAQLLNVYYSKEPVHCVSPWRGTVRWYILVKDLDTTVLETTFVDLDQNNEVVESVQEHNIPLEDVVRKCYLVIGMENDSKSCIEKSNLDPNISYFCRYKLEKNKLKPLLCNYLNNSMECSNSLLHSIMNREHCDNLMVVVTSDSETDSEDEYKGQIGCASPATSQVKRKEITNIKLGSEGSESELEEIDVVRVKSPFNLSKTLKLRTINNPKLKSLNCYSTTLKTNELVTSPPPYSIIQPVDVKNGDLKMKLRVMDYLRPVSVYPTKLDDKIIMSNLPINVEDIIEKNNCVLLSPNKKFNSFETPTKNNIAEKSKSISLRRSSRRSSKCSPKYTPQRRSSRINSQTTCSYVENNDSFNLDNIDEETLVQSVNNISLCNTPYSQTKTSYRKNNRLQMTTPSKTTPVRKKTQEDVKDSKSLTVTRSVARKKSHVSKKTASLNKNKLDHSPTSPYMGISSEDLNSVKKKLKYDSDNDSEPTTPKRKHLNSASRSSTRNISTAHTKMMQGGAITSSVPVNNFEPTAPKRKHFNSPSRSNIKNTPSARAKMIREGVITPSVPARNKAVLKDSTPLSKARMQLHVSYIPQALPCRETEFENISNFLTGKICDGSGGCMYISGVPGTGKTATVTGVIKGLESFAKNGDIPKFISVSVNCMRLSEPRQAYVEISKQLTGKAVGWEQAQSLLEEKFVNSKTKSLPIVLVVDELDILCTKRQDVVYNILDWPTKANVQLIVVAIANTMDLPERLLVGRVTSRLGLTRLTFQAYTHKQLQEIVTKRLTGTNAFNPDAIQLVARKIASVSGDARRALDICRRAAEIAEKEGKFTLVSMSHVNEALNAMITQPKVQAIKHCCKLEKLILQAIVAEVDRTGIEETNFQNVYQTLLSVSSLDGFPMASITTVKSGIARLSNCRLLLVDQKSCNIYQKIILNVSTDDIHYALTK